jgi:hypothetical protein
MNDLFDLYITWENWTKRLSEAWDNLGFGWLWLEHDVDLWSTLRIFFEISISFSLIVIADWSSRNSPSTLILLHKCTMSLQYSFIDMCKWGPQISTGSLAPWYYMVYKATEDIVKGWGQGVKRKADGNTFLFSVSVFWLSDLWDPTF